MNLSSKTSFNPNAYVSVSQKTLYYAKSGEGPDAKRRDTGKNNKDPDFTSKTMSSRALGFTMFSRCLNNFARLEQMTNTYVSLYFSCISLWEAGKRVFKRNLCGTRTHQHLPRSLAWSLRLYSDRSKFSPSWSAVLRSCGLSLSAPPFSSTWKLGVLGIWRYLKFKGIHGRRKSRFLSKSEDLLMWVS